MFLVGDRAYKMKKPVRTDFLDFGTAAQRRSACLREVELNRRLAPDVYLGVSDVLLPNGAGSALDTGPAEHLVVCRRIAGSPPWSSPGSPSPVRSGTWLG